MVCKNWLSHLYLARASEGNHRSNLERRKHAIGNHFYWWYYPRMEYERLSTDCCSHIWHTYGKTTVEGNSRDLSSILMFPSDADRERALLPSTSLLRQWATHGTWWRLVKMVWCGCGDGIDKHFNSLNQIHQSHFHVDFGSRIKFAVPRLTELELILLLLEMTALFMCFLPWKVRSIHWTVDLKLSRVAVVVNWTAMLWGDQRRRGDPVWCRTLT